MVSSHGRGSLALVYFEDVAPRICDILPIRPFCMQRFDRAEWRHQLAFNNMIKRCGLTDAFKFVLTPRAGTNSSKRTTSMDPPVLTFKAANSHYQSPLAPWCRRSKPKASRTCAGHKQATTSRIVPDEIHWLQRSNVAVGFYVLTYAGDDGKARVASQELLVYESRGVSWLRHKKLGRLHIVGC